MVSSFARQLVMAVHPDQVGEAKIPAIAADRIRIITAIIHLSDEQAFLAALAELKTLRSIDRDELNFEREVSKKLREDHAILTSKLLKQKAKNRRRSRQ